MRMELLTTTFVKPTVKLGWQLRVFAPQAELAAVSEHAVKIDD